MRINHNIPALRALFQNQKTNSSLEKALEKLSSGKRINRAADDAAGMAISNKLDAQIRGLKQANRNANDGISLIQTAEGALNEVESMVQRMRELSVQASNGTLAPEDRDAVQKEMSQLLEEIDRVSNDIEFNEMTLLNGDLDRITIFEPKNGTKMISVSEDVEAKIYSVELQKPEAATSKGTSITPLPLAADAEIEINGATVQFKAGDTAAQIIDKINKESGSTDVTASLVGTNEIELVRNSVGEKPIVLGGTGLTALGLSPVATSTDGKDPITSASLTAAFPTGTTVELVEGNMLEIKGDDNFRMLINTDKIPTTGTQNLAINVTDVGPLRIHIGANENQSMEVRIPNMSAKALGIDKINVNSSKSSNEALGVLDDAINNISLVRAQLGAYQNRLEYTGNNLNTATENMTSSLSRILDVDMAEEMAHYTQLNIISQSGMSMIAQANQRPEQVLQLLRG